MNKRLFYMCMRRGKKWRIRLAEKSNWIQIEKICESQFNNTFFTEITYFSVHLRENYRIVQCPISFAEKEWGSFKNFAREKKNDSFERIIFSWSFFFFKSMYFSWSKQLLYFYIIYLFILKSSSHAREVSVEIFKWSMHLH